MKGVDTLSKYYSIHEFSKIIGVSAQTLRNWDANGKLHPHHTTVSGYRYYSDEQLNQVIHVKPKNRITIGYCRVSSRSWSRKVFPLLGFKIKRIFIIFSVVLLPFGCF